jgi:L-seryl-tRNA(Ser) seleniumtransferase
VGGRSHSELSSASGASRQGRLRALPAVHEVAAQLPAPHILAVRAARLAVDEQRAQLVAGAEAGDVLERARRHLAGLTAPSLRRVINATGVIVHTNLGRAPLAAAARDAVAQVALGYSNLELDLASGERGSRHDHVEGLLAELTGAEAALVVNNGAGAVLLAAAALAGPGQAIVVSRGQLVEIGGGFRIPEVIAQSGATMVEVGTTNRTHRADYERALACAPAPVAAILRVHQSNFRTLGFVEEVPIEELCRLGPRVIDDVGSGVLADDSGILALGEEPDLKRSIAAGAALVCCSGDKLLGGPQAGLLLGTRAAVATARGHPLARALRIDKLSLAALEATLLLLRDPGRARREIPVLAMLEQPEEVLAARATRLRDGIGERAEVVRAVARVGGGALPVTELEGPVVALEAAVDPVAALARLRADEPPVIARIHDGRVLLDPRTIAEDEVDAVVAAARRALADG